MPQLLEYDLGAGVRAFSTERRGGVSRGAYSSFNANRFCGDAAHDVEANRRLLCRQLDIATDHLVIPHQVLTVPRISGRPSSAWRCPKPTIPALDSYNLGI